MMEFQSISVWLFQLSDRLISMQHVGQHPSTSSYHTQTICGREPNQQQVDTRTTLRFPLPILLKNTLFEVDPKQKVLTKRYRRQIAVTCEIKSQQIFPLQSLLFWFLLYGDSIHFLPSIHFHFHFKHLSST